MSAMMLAEELGLEEDDQLDALHSVCHDGSISRVFD